jgi:uncharacterized membrane protein YeiB
MTGLLASVAASLVAWLAEALLAGHVSATAEYGVSFVIWSLVFVPSYVWIKRLREGL